MMRSPFSSSVKMSSCRPCRLSSRCENISWEQAAHALGSEDALYADGHRRGAVRNLVFLRAPDYLRKGMLKDAEEFVGHLRFAPGRSEERRVGKECSCLVEPVHTIVTHAAFVHQ